MNKTNIKLIFKGQLNRCPLLFKAFFVILSSLFLPACSKKQPDNKNTFVEPTVNSSVETKAPRFKKTVGQAKECDVTTPVGFKLLSVDNRRTDCEFFVFQGKSSIYDATEFYKRELEITGWDFKDLSTKHEGLFVCNKPQKTCVISIRSQGSRDLNICITIFDENKQSNSNTFSNQINL